MKYVPIVALCCLPLAAWADELSDRLERREVVVEITKIKGRSAPAVKATALFAAPVEKLWKIIDHCADYHTTMLRIAKSEELSREGSRVRCRVTIEMPFPLANVTTETVAVHTVVPGKLAERRWKQAEGDFRVNTGSWTLTPYGDGKRTLAVYQVRAEPKVEVPAALRDAAQRKTLPQLFEHLRKQVE